MSSYYSPQTSQAARALTELLMRRTGRSLRRTDARTGAISSYLQPFAGRAQGYYDQAQASERGVGQAVAGGLTSLGQQLGGDINAALAGIQAPGAAVSTYGGGTAATGAAAGQAVGALSSAELGRLQGHSTAEQVYASALPRLAQLAGEQERRMIFAQAQEDLGDLALQQAAQGEENAWRERQFAYERQQDRIANQRLNQQGRERRQETRYGRRQDKAERERQARLDRMAAAAAEQEYGLDIADYRLDERQQAERERSARTREQQAAAREQRLRARDARLAAGKGTREDRNEVFYEAREGAFERARDLAEQNAATRRPSGRVSRKQARDRIFAEYGRLLIGRGFPPKSIDVMIRAALDAAGF